MDTGAIRMRLEYVLALKAIQSRTLFRPYDGLARCSCIVEVDVRSSVLQLQSFNCLSGNGGG